MIDGSNPAGVFKSGMERVKLLVSPGAWPLFVCTWTLAGTSGNANSGAVPFGGRFLIVNVSVILSPAVNTNGLASSLGMSSSPRITVRTAAG